MAPYLHDPCLFLSKDVSVVVRVGDLLVYGHNKALINSFVDCMTNKEEVKLRREDTTEGYLSVDIKLDGNKMILPSLS